MKIIGGSEIKGERERETQRQREKKREEEREREGERGGGREREGGRSDPHLRIDRKKDGSLNGPFDQGHTGTCSFSIQLEHPRRRDRQPNAMIVIAESVK